MVISDNLRLSDTKMSVTTRRQARDEMTSATESTSRDVQSSSDEQSMADQEDGGDVSKRLARSRERNREHARRTRLRKKAQLEALQSKVEGLEAERNMLRQKVEECSIASILLGLSSKTYAPQTELSIPSFWDKPAAESDNAVEAVKPATTATGKRKRFLSDASDSKGHNQAMMISIDGQLTLIGGGKSHVNWKTGVYSDEQGNQRHLTLEQLEGLR
jgi:bZIP transcription factor